MQKITPIILVVVSVLLLVNLTWTAIIFKNFSDVLKIAKDSYDKANAGFVETVRTMKDSAVVERFVFVARGNIQTIEDLNLTLEYKGSTLKIAVLPDAQIVKQTDSVEIPETISFQDLRVGDEVSVSVAIEKEGGQGAYRVKVITEGGQ